MAHKTMKGWLVPAALLLLGALPILTGMLQLLAISEGLATGVAPSPDSETYVAHPVPIVLHIAAGSLFMVLGALQFAAPLRSHAPQWHRGVGRAAIAAATLTALTALWMNQTFPAFGGIGKYASNLFFGIALPASLAIAYLAIKRRAIASHRAWMMRAFAIGLGPATQRALFLPWFIAFGFPDGPWLGLLLLVGWLINLGIVEWLLWRPRGGGRVPT